MSRSITLAVLLLVSSRAPAADKPTEIAYFEKHVRPLLIRRCYSCHSARSKPIRGELRLDTRRGWQTGGESGPAIRPGRLDDSLLIQAIRHGDDVPKMPPKKKLPVEEIRILERWVARGAVDPRTGDPTSGRKRGGADHWAFQPVRPGQIPNATKSHANWSRTPIDRFVLARLADAGLAPSPPADRRVLIRRVAFDLTGLPPTPEQVAAFLADNRPGAWGRLIDRLLGSPHYGARWGRHWLDVARYADSNGLDENVAHGNAWRYRDWVIDSLNADRPFDSFVRDQLAGDLGPGRPGESEQQRHRRMIATGFLSLGPKVLAEVDAKKMEMDIVDEQVDTVGRAFLGLTLGCARCHDHKFDPVSTRDYYALAGVFQSTRTMEHFNKVARWWENPIATAADQQRLETHKIRITGKKAAIDALVEAATKVLGDDTPTGGKGKPKPGDIEKRFSDDTRLTLKRLRQELETLRGATPELPTAMGVTDGTVTNLAVHIRGSHLDLGDSVPRGVPVVIAGPDAKPFPARQSGRRELAEWLTRPDNPLAARVFVNRLWRWHFGRGLVASTDNFGQLGRRPSHPRLLDFLAAELVRGDWSIKRLHRLIVLSATYRMQSSPRKDAMAVDPENRLWWRSPLRRLEAEALRDAMLAVTGELDPQMGGSLLHVKNRGYFFDHTSKDETRYNVPRRSVYLPVVRNHLYDVFTLFDYTDASVMTGDRASTIVAPQALFLLNSELVEQASRRLARTVLASQATDDSERIDRLCEHVLGRPATTSDLRRSSGFLERIREALPENSQPTDAWSALCHVLLASNEFIYLK